MKPLIVFSMARKPTKAETAALGELVKVIENLAKLRAGNVQPCRLCKLVAREGKHVSKRTRRNLAASGDGSGPLPGWRMT